MVLKDPREKLMIDERNKTLWLCLFKKSLLEKVLSRVKHVRLNMTARDKGAPDKGHTTLFSSSKVVHYFPNFRSYFGMEYEQPWNMGKILLEYIYIYLYECHLNVLGQGSTPYGFYFRAPPGSGKSGCISYGDAVVIAYTSNGGNTGCGWSLGFAPTN